MEALTAVSSFSCQQFASVQMMSKSTLTNARGCRVKRFHVRRAFLQRGVQVFATVLFSTGFNRIGWCWDEDSLDTSPEDFHRFLDDATPLERTQLAQSLNMFRDLEEDDFGRCLLAPFDDFVTTSEEATTGKAVRPRSFNELPPNLVLAAIEDNRLDRNLIDKYEILSALLWNYYNSVGFWFTDRDKVNYHEIVQWVARGKGVDSGVVSNASTFRLEQEVYKRVLGGIWDKLNVTQRMELLTRVEKDVDILIEDKNALVEMDGEEAVKILGRTPLMEGYKFYAALMIFTVGAAAYLGLSLPLTGGILTAAGVAAPLGPIAWAGVSIAALGSLAWLALPNIDKVATFVMTMNSIKAARLEADRVAKASEAPKATAD
jgi:hypothetical protein